MSAADSFARVLSRLGVKALRMVLPRLSPSERLWMLQAVQNRALETMGDDEEVLLRRYAAKTVDLCLERVTTSKQTEILTDTNRRALERIHPCDLSEACASLINMARLHPRLVDPASNTARAGDDRPVVVGPWLMEIGFELLYWIPYVRAQLKQLGIPKERVIVVSRGGAEGWYDGIASRYLDLLDVMTPQEFHDWTSGVGAGEEIAKGNRKTFKAECFETNILDRVLSKASIGDFQVIMPSAMYGLMRNVWRGRFGSHGLAAHLEHVLMKKPQAIDLPFTGPYVAVKFYHSRTFPKTPELAALARRVVCSLSERSNVVILSNAAQLDDHDTLGAPAEQSQYQIFDASGLYTPRNNLAVQTALVAHASEMHGTYGGFSYLGPLLGVDTVAYTGSCDFTITHLDLAWMTFERIGGAQLTVVPSRPGREDGDEERNGAGPLPRPSLQHAFSV